MNASLSTLLFLARSVVLHIWALHLYSVISGSIWKVAQDAQAYYDETEVLVISSRIAHRNVHSRIKARFPGRRTNGRTSQS